MKIASEQEMIELGRTLADEYMAGDGRRGTPKMFCESKNFGGRGRQDPPSNSVRQDPPSNSVRQDPPSNSARQDPPSDKPIVFELIGDVGAGKTTLVKGLAIALGVSEPITSPSFTISKSYACKDGKTLTHYDFYRLDDPGIMIEDLEEKLADDNQIIVIEWGGSVKNILPENHTTITINYNDDNTREVTIK